MGDEHTYNGKGRDLPVPVLPPPATGCWEGCVPNPMDGGSCSPHHMPGGLRGMAEPETRKGPGRPANSIPTPPQLFLNTALSRSDSYAIKLTHSKYMIIPFFGIVTELCIHHHNLILEHFYPAPTKGALYPPALCSPTRPREPDFTFCLPSSPALQLRKQRLRADKCPHWSGVGVGVLCPPLGAFLTNNRGKQLGRRASCGHESGSRHIFTQMELLKQK